MIQNFQLHQHQLPSITRKNLDNVLDCWDTIIGKVSTFLFIIKFVILIIEIPIFEKLSNVDCIASDCLG